MSFLNNTANRVGSSVNNILGDAIGDVTGLPAQDIPLYNKFLYNILSDADNAVTVPQYWVVFFSINPVSLEKKGLPSLSSLISGAKKALKSEFGLSSAVGSTAGFDLDVTPWVIGDKTKIANDQFFNDNVENTMMLVQGIEIPGDGFSISRQGADNIGGFLRPPITGIRNDMPEMEITFLENNSSVTDLVLRPWVIESSYKSLKFANKTTITCYNLTRSPSGFRIRKRFMFHNAVPISIDSEQYSYKSDSSYVTRQTKFVFSHYSIDEGDSMKDTLLASVANMALQKTRRFISGVVESGVDVVAGGANQIYTNIKGSFTDTVNDHLQDVQSRIREYGKNAESSIIDNGKRIIDKAIGFNPDKDSIMRGGEDFPTSGTSNNPSPRIPVNVESTDNLTSPPIPPKSSGVSNDVKYSIRKINNDDVPDTRALNLKEVTINNSNGVLSTTVVEAPQDDTIRRK